MLPASSPSIVVLAYVDVSLSSTGSASAYLAVSSNFTLEVFAPLLSLATVCLEARFDFTLFLSWERADSVANFFVLSTLTFLFGARSLSEIVRVAFGLSLDDAFFDATSLLLLHSLERSDGPAREFLLFSCCSNLVWTSPPSSAFSALVTALVGVTTADDGGVPNPLSSGTSTLSTVCSSSSIRLSSNDRRRLADGTFDDCAVPGVDVADTPMSFSISRSLF
mmetsp:Transcript_8208/g.18434  ORF Transcript_8208/g.18434 Transcript_8208/m.18434 type:complete len:222 (-) Transcript_8208:924-1589(-)